MRRAWLIAALALTGCNQGSPQPRESAESMAPINAPAKPVPAASASSSPAATATPSTSASSLPVRHFVATGTEPFWSVDVAGAKLRYSNPENQSGVTATVVEAKDGTGVRYSGRLRGQAIDLSIQPGKCSDGMSDKNYAYNAKLLIGTSSLAGCADLK